MWPALRLGQMNVAYINGDCEGVTQSSPLHASLRPVDGATALSKTLSGPLRARTGICREKMDNNCDAKQ